MKQFHILRSTDASLQDKIKLVHDLFEEILIDDNDWHFFEEMEYGIYLRCGDKSVDKVDAWLQKHNVQAVVSDYDKDDNPVVTRFFEEFIEIFHAQSIMAMHLYNILDNDYDNKNTIARILEALLEREAHSLCNKCMFAVEDTLMADAKREFREPEMWEGLLTAKVASGRLMYSGMRYMFKKSYIEEDKEK